MSRRELESNQQPPACKTGALPVELSAREEIRDKGSNLDLHVQSVASCRLDDPGMHVFTNHVVYATRLPFGPGSIRIVLRGGVLEPGALASTEK